MTANSDDDPRLADLLLRWEELQGTSPGPSAEELCRDCPELVEELRRRVAVLRQLDSLMAGTTEEQWPRSVTVDAASQRSATARAEFCDLRFHSAGALGEVFMARNAELNREVALKFLRPERLRDPDSRRRFFQEAEVTGRLEHPGVVPIYAIGTDPAGSPCYAMRFIRGETLHRAIDAFHAADQAGRDPSERSLELRELLNRFVSICSTMGYAHSRGILHRDLKPRNVMLGKYDETLVVDWGLAKPFELGAAVGTAGEEALTPSSGSGEGGSDTPTVGVVGTPAYMSPEQAEARWEVVGPASDIFGLGSILYAILTGQAPYQGPKVGAILERAKRCEFLPPRQVKPGVPRALEAVCLRAMARRPEDRYATAPELAADVRRWLADEPVMAYCEPAAARARRWMRRRRTLMAGAAAAALAGLIGLAAVATVQDRSNRELKTAYARVSSALDAETRARNDKEAALSQSEEARKRAEAVLGFLKEDVLAAARPEGQEGGLGKDVTVRRAVDAAEPRIAQAFKDQPIVEAEVRDTLGLTYYDLGETTMAIRQFELAVDLRGARLGPDHPETLASRNALGEAYRLARRTSESIRYNEATLALAEAKLGPDHPTTLASRNNLAQSYYAAGRAADAVEQNERALKLYEAKFGPDHPETLASRNNLATAYEKAGRIADAIRLNEIALKQTEAALGPNHPTTLSSRNNLAWAYLTAGRAAEAVELNKVVLEGLEKQLGQGHPNTLITRINLAMSLEAAGRPVEAERPHREVLARQRQIEKPDSPVLAGSLGALGANLLTQARWSEAEPLLRECLAIRESVIPDVWSRFNTMSQLGGALLGQGRYAEAEPLVVGGYEGLKAREAKISPTGRPRLPQAAERVIGLYEAWGRPDKVAAWKAKLGLADLPADPFARPITASETRGSGGGD
jgi:tetratricopeptide (TPR) repeat protein/tRNA A-37 threonylcarbamoyl transferase component Bud32